MTSKTPPRYEDDFWLEIPCRERRASELPPGAGLIFEPVPKAEPLSRSPDRSERGYIPSAILPWLFSSASTDVAAVPDISTFAVVDGARMPNLPELIETSGLEGRSLLGEDTDQRLILSGPWLVQLDPDSRFTRRFFMENHEQRSDQALWMTNWGIFIRSRSNLEGLSRHLRKFTKIKDEHGQWFFFRFWDSDFMGLYLRQPQAAQLPLVLRLLDPNVIERTLIANPFDGVYSVRLDLPQDSGSDIRPRIGFRRSDFNTVGVELADRRAARAYHESYLRLIGDESLDDLRARISEARAACNVLGVTQEGLPGTFILLGTIFDRTFWMDDAFEPIGRPQPRRPI